MKFARETSPARGSEKMRSSHVGYLNHDAGSRGRQQQKHEEHLLAWNVVLDVQPHLLSHFPTLSASSHRPSASLAPSPRDSTATHTSSDSSRGARTCDFSRDDGEMYVTGDWRTACALIVANGASLQNNHMAEA